MIESGLHLSLHFLRYLDSTVKQLQQALGLHLCSKLCFGFGCSAHFSDFDPQEHVRQCMEQLRIIAKIANQEPTALLEVCYLSLQVLRLHKT